MAIYGSLLLFFSLTISYSIYPETASVQHALEIERPIEEVFQYVTTPDNWPKWHPSSLGVKGASDHSLQIGEKVTEAFAVAGREGEVVWVVSEREAPYSWTIEGDIIDGNGTGGTVAYVLSPTANGTRFQRTFTYRLTNYGYYLLNALFVSKRINKESQAAVEQLKRVLEANASAK